MVQALSHYREVGSSCFLVLAKLADQLNLWWQRLVALWVSQDLFELFGGNRSGTTPSSKLRVAVWVFNGATTFLDDALSQLISTSNNFCIGSIERFEVAWHAVFHHVVEVVLVLNQVAICVVEAFAAKYRQDNVNGLPRRQSVA